MKRYAVTVDGAPLPSGAYDQTITVRCKGVWNVNFVVTEVINAIGRPLRIEEDDWLDLLRAIHVADLVCHRGENEAWNRFITLAVPLRSPDHLRQWLPLLQEIFGRMTHDHLDIRLIQDPAPSPSRFPQRHSPSQIDAVALLSGGLDSACAAIDVLQQYKHPCLVSYWASPHIRGAQKQVVTALADKQGHPLQTATFRLTLKHQHAEVPLPASELSQRSRPLLFAGVAATLAAARGLETVTLGENGVMAINCPLTMGRAGGFSTHTAHPDILTLMGNLFTHMLGQPIRVDNPLLHQTKTEVVADLAAVGLEDLIPKTHSCWIARQARHCGVCVPCVVRRFAVEAAQAQDAVYEHDSFNDSAPRDNRKFEAIGDYLLFARTIEELSDEELLLEFSELNIEGGPAMRKSIIQTHRRWTHDVLHVAQAHPSLAALL
jgi:7-cyano-7-deazaguanine synthase in queuosine biosynthesis